MKLTKLTNLMVVGLALTVCAVGCRKRPNTITGLPGQGPGTVGGGDHPIDAGLAQPTFNPTDRPTTTIEPINPVIPANPSGQPIAVSTNDFSNYIQDRETFAHATVYFDFDKSSIRSSDHSKISEVAAHLKSHPGSAVRVEGNCDERGTEEYNRSLGERRALAAREALVAAGVDPNLVETVSFGEDKPAEPGHNEASYAKNRRAEFVLLTPPGAK